MPETERRCERRIYPSILRVMIIVSQRSPACSTSTNLPILSELNSVICGWHLHSEFLTHLLIDRVGLRLSTFLLFDSWTRLNLTQIIKLDMLLPPNLRTCIGIESLGCPFKFLQWQCCKYYYWNNIGER